MKNFLSFPSKEERNDFLIALIVLGFFAWILFFFLASEEKTSSPIAAELSDSAVATPVVMTSTSTTKVIDSDGDGVEDKDDTCPNLVGLVENEGCPSDTDKDGIYDGDDKCPNLAGVAKNRGCPSDTDKDGIYDKDDKCPNLAGINTNTGCPPDGDKDGIYDKDDKCPNLAGTAKNKGCPEIILSKEEKNLMESAVKKVAFDTGSAYLKRNSMKILKDITIILQKYPSYKLSINGHTDNQGDPAKNLDLSKARAKACYDYFLEKNIAPTRISHEGFGDQKAVGDNATAKGRQQNRRVVFDLHY